MRRCEICGVEIKFVRTPAGNFACLEVEPHDGLTPIRTYIIRDGVAVQARELTSETQYACHTDRPGHHHRAKNAHDYDAYMKSKLWTETRFRLGEAVGWACQECGAGPPSPLEFHHLNYEKPPGTETSDDVLVLCKSCHDKKRPAAAA